MQGKIDNITKKSIIITPRGEESILILMVYEKANGQIIKRRRSTLAPYKIGDTTSMGWKVIDILYLYDDNKYYPKYEYDRLVDKAFKKRQRFNKSLKIFANVCKQFRNCLTLLVLFRVFELINHIS